MVHLTWPLFLQSIESVLGTATYQNNKVNQWTSSIVEQCLNQLTKLGKPFKYIGIWTSLNITSTGWHHFHHVLSPLYSLPSLLWVFLFSHPLPYHHLFSTSHSPTFSVHVTDILLPSLSPTPCLLLLLTYTSDVGDNAEKWCGAAHSKFMLLG